MRKIILFVFGLNILLSISKAGDLTPSVSATYKPFIEDGKSWVITSSISHGWMPVFQVDTYYIDGDTIVNGQLCKRLMLRVNDYVNHTISNTLNKLVFEQGQKVFCFPLDEEGVASQNSVLLYDFGAEPNDTLSLNGINHYPENFTKCFQIWDSIQLKYNDELFFGQLATLYNPDLTESEVHNNYDYPLYHWFQAIGSTHHPFIKTAWNKNYTGMLYLLRDCRIGKKIIYTNWKDSSFFPDFTGDGDIDVADVNAVINSMLGTAPYVGEKMDATGDNNVDIADVNAIINVMLAAVWPAAADGLLDLRPASKTHNSKLVTHNPKL